MTSARRRSLLSNALWAKHEAHYFKAFPVHWNCFENVISSARRSWVKSRTLFLFAQGKPRTGPRGRISSTDGRVLNQPDPNDRVRAERESKRPDFNWGFTDPHEEDFRTSAKQFVVECKRLGAAPRSDWVLTENYVEHGILRFIDPVWS